MFQKILVGSDGSDEALHAARLAAALAKPLKATVTVLNAFNLTAAVASFSAPETLPYSQLAFEYGEQAQQDILKRTGAVLEAEGVSCQTRAELGHPVDVTVRVAEQEKSDLIVLGSQGLSGLPKFLLGSVSEGIARRAPCPVLIARGPTQAIHHILAASDGSQGAGKALQAAADLAPPLGATLTVLNVLEPGKPFPGIDPKDTDEAVYALRVRQAVMQKADETLQGTGLDYRFSQEQGHPVETIAEFAAANGVDLIALGSRGLGGFQRLLLGSVSEGVLRYAPCAALIVR